MPKKDHDIIEEYDVEFNMWRGKGIQKDLIRKKIGRRRREWLGWLG